MGYQKVDIPEIPVDPEGNCLVDLFVYMPSSERYVRYICAGDPLDENRVNAVKEHVVPNLFVEGDKEVLEEVDTTKVFKADEQAPDDFKIEVVGKEKQAELKKIFKSFLDPVEPPSTVLTQIENQANDIIDAVAPETKDLKGHLLKNVRYINRMNDASAISALAVLVALAAGYDSQKSYRDIAYACRIMDAALTEFDDEVIDTWYRNPSELAPDIQEKIKKHPVRSHQIAQEKIKSLSDVTLQLILSHHELFNGKGYPRGVRYESLFPMVKVLSFAVSIFEFLKKAELEGQESNIIEAVLSFRDLDQEAHLRRHSKKLVDSVIAFLNIPEDLLK